MKSGLYGSRTQKKTNWEKTRLYIRNLGIQFKNGECKVPSACFWFVFNLTAPYMKQDI